jgi:isocitrate dehydrogenase kinase/phosphatase
MVEQLQQELANVRQERDQARWEVAQGRKRFETEAQQRRDEAVKAQQAISALRTELESPPLPLDAAMIDPEFLQTLQAEILAQTDVEALQSQLIATQVERQQLLQALKMEQADHAQTRHSLTNALGDAIEALSRYRQQGSPPGPGF